MHSCNHALMQTRRHVDNAESTGASMHESEQNVLHVFTITSSTHDDYSTQGSCILRIVVKKHTRVTCRSFTFLIFNVLSHYEPSTGCCFAA